MQQGSYSIFVSSCMILFMTHTILANLLLCHNYNQFVGVLTKPYKKLLSLFG